MALRKKLAILSAVLPLVACGGGGGGDGDSGAAGSPLSPPTPTPTPAPSTPASFVITEENAVDTAVSALGSSEPLPVVAVRVNAALDRLAYLRQPTVPLLCGNALGGTASHVDNDGNGRLSAGDRVTLEHRCARAAMNVQAELLRYDAYGYSARVAFEMESDVPATRASGRGTVSLGSSGLAITDAATDFTIDGFVEKLTLASANYTFDDGYVISLAGTVASARLGGTFSFRTEAPLRGFGGSLPRSGELSLTGNASSALFHAPAGDGVGQTGEYAVAANGDPYGSRRAVDWASLRIGPMFFWIGGDTPLVTRLELIPAVPSARDPIEASFSAEDPNGEPLAYEFTWRVNGWDQPYMHDQSRLAPGPYGKGDVVEVRLYAFDSDARATAIRTVTIGNAAPSFTAPLAFSPAAPNITHAITVLPTADDIDGDAVSYTYEWRRNGVPLPGQTSNVLPANGYARGDVITAVVTARDGTATATTERSVTVVDAPPIATALAAPTAAPFGVPLVFDVDAVDPDGDSVSGLPFRLLYGPAGMTVSSETGEVNWRPSGPMFDKTVDVAWSITIDAPGAIPVTGTVEVTDPSRQYPLLRGSFGWAVGPAAMKVADFDGDGDNEALILGQTLFYELSSDGAQGYKQSWAYPFALVDRDDPYTRPDITAFATSDIDRDGRHEIFVAAQGLIARLDGLERRVGATASIGESLKCTHVEHADLDGDGAGEIVCLTETTFGSPPNTIIVLTETDLSPRWQAPMTTYGRSIALGNVDDDSALEIVTAGGHVIDGRSFSTEWLYTPPSGVYDPGFGFDVHTADLDRDGVDEIVAAVEANAPIRVYDARARAVRWHVAGDEDYGALELSDLDGDGSPEILVGEQQWGALTAYRVVGESAEIMFTLDDRQSVEAIAVGDLDGDGAAEILWSEFYAPFLQIASRTGVVEWVLEADLGNFVGGRLAGSPLRQRAPLFVAGSVESDRDDGIRLVSLNVPPGDYAISPSLVADERVGQAFAITDYDLDGTDEAIVPIHGTWESRLAAYDAFTGQQEWVTAGTSAPWAIAFANADVTGDGHDDLITISANGQVEIHDVFADSLGWQSAVLYNGVDVAVGQLDDDGVPDVVVVTQQGVRVFERAGPSFVETAAATYSQWEPRLAEIDDVDGDGEPELIVLSHASTYPRDRSLVQRLDSSLNELGSFRIPWRATSMAVEPSATPRNNLVIPTVRSTSGASRVVALDALNGQEIWRSPLIRREPWTDSIHFVTVPGEAEPRLAIGNAFGAYLTR